MRPAMLLTGLLAMTAAAQEPGKDPPPKEDPFPRRVTIRFTGRPGDRIGPLTGVKAQFGENEFTKETLWRFQVTPVKGRAPVKGDEIEEEDGDTKGTVWKVTRVSTGGKVCAVEKVPPPEKKD